MPGIEWMVLLLALVIGIVLGWLVGELRGRAEANTARAIAQEVKAQAEQRVADARVEADKRLTDQKKVFDEDRQKLTEAFQALAAQALATNNKSFLDLAGEKLQPVQESLKNLSGHIAEIEKARNQAYGALRQQVDELRLEAGNLARALRAPAIGGRWGEIQLRRVVEMAGMVKQCDFYEQESHETEEGRLRPDMRVLLPGARNIVVDAKTPLGAYLEALQAQSEDARQVKLKEHARHVREHMAALAAKGYWERLQPTPEFVVMFLPGETFFAAALEQDPALIEQGVEWRVIIATPTTLIALLRAVAYGWRQEQIADNAQRISDLGRELYERLATMGGHLAGLGSALRTAVERFNQTVGSMESRVLSAARRFKELGVAARSEVQELEPIETEPRQLTEPEADK